MRPNTLSPRLLVVAAAAATLVLLVFAGAYYMTYEPAPNVRVRWRDGVTAERRAEAERRFLLVRPVPYEGRTMAYDLLDISRNNVKALVAHPDIEDTHYIDRAESLVPFGAPYGESWMWIANRTPFLRVRGVVASLVTASALLLAASTTLLLYRWRTRALSLAQG
jgi:hypothetical protein